MEVKINALMLKSVDYKDNDKMLTLYSLEQGLIGASIRGVKKAGAKLGFSAQPFCFAEYILSVNGERATVIGATEIESFYNVRLHIGAYYASCVVAEFLIKCGSEQSDEKMFMLAVNTIKKLNFNPQDANGELCKFLYRALNLLGYGIKADGCASCKSDATQGEYSYFDFESGALYCEDCSLPSHRKILNGTANGLQQLSLNQPMPSESQALVLKFLNYYLEQKTGETLKTINELLNL